MADYENMSDEDFAKLQEPVAETPVEEPAPVEEAPVPEAEAAPVEEAPAAEEAPNTDSSEGGDVPGSEEDDPVEDAASGSDVDDDAFLKAGHTTPKPTEAEQPKPEAPAPEAAAEGDEKPTAEGDPAAEEEDPKPAEPVEPDAAQTVAENYAKIMAPFKANGTEFSPKSPDEVIQLMQMGANYVKKMQALKPNLRMMRMLENKNLLDEEKLNFLIDVNDRNPQAIQKLLQDANIDPLDFDNSQPVQYKPNNHAVSDAQFTFQETLNDLQSNESGRETVQTIYQTWDKTSKEEVFKDPRILNLIDEQRQSGIYAKITTELERQKMLGNFADIPFIHAYKAVGDYLHEQGMLIDTPPAQAAPAAPAGGNVTPAKPREVVETRAATPKPQVVNDPRVQSMAPTRSTPTPQKSFDLFAMSDEEIMRMSLPSS